MDKNVSELFADKYNGIYNSVPYDVDAMNRIKECAQHRLHNNMAECDEVTTDDIENITVENREAWWWPRAWVRSSNLQHNIIT